MRADDETAAFDVAFVCTGNRFRSAIAAAVFRLAAGDVPVRVRSFGTLDVGDAPALPEAIKEAARLDLDLTSHRASPIGRADLAKADLVVGFERMHLVTAVVDARARLETVFTLPELVGILERLAPPDDADPVARARSLVARADRPRPRDVARWRPPEVDDPLGLPGDVQRVLAVRVHDLTTRLASGLFGHSAD